MFVGRCVCFCVCAKEGEVCPCSKPFEVLHIWAGYLERMLCRANTYRQGEREGKKEGCFYCFRASFSINLSLPCVDSAFDL